MKRDEIELNLLLETTNGTGVTVETDLSCVLVPAPLTERGRLVEGLAEWAGEYLYPVTGMGRVRPDVTYGITVTYTSDPDAVPHGAYFEF